MTELAQPPLSLWQAPQYASWAMLSDRAGVGLIFGIGGPCDVIVRCPLSFSFDLCTDIYQAGIADEFQLGCWRWHSKPLGAALQRMREAFRRDRDFRREAWREAEGLGLLAMEGVKL